MFAKNTLVLKNEMTTYKITPDFNVNNMKNEVLTNVFSNLYESLMSRISLSNINMLIFIFSRWYYYHLSHSLFFPTFSSAPLRSSPCPPQSVQILSIDCTP